MADKKKILVISDASCVSTGFGRVADEVLKRLHETGEWEIHQIGINFFDTPHDKPYRIYMASAENRNDWLGTSRIRTLYKTLDPDVVWLFQDFWHIASYIQTSPNMRGLCVYYPVDSKNIKSNWAIYMSSAVEVATYTDFAAAETSKAISNALDNLIATAREQKKQEVDKIKLHTQDNTGILVSANRLLELSDPSNITVIPHGVDNEVFHYVDKATARKAFGFSDEWFIVGNVNRNQPRKRLDLMIKAFSEFAKDKPNARLLLHDPLPSKHEGWDLIQLATERYDVGDKLLLNGTDMKGKNLSVEELNLLYNSLDVMVNSGGGEGWGLPTHESACCRVPQIVPNWSATAEIWKDSAILIDIAASVHQPVINTEQCVIDTDHLVTELSKMYFDTDHRMNVAAACHATATKEIYNWDNIAKTFIDMFNRAAEKRFIYDDTKLTLDSSPEKV